MYYVCLIIICTVYCIINIIEAILIYKQTNTPKWPPTDDIGSSQTR